MRFPLLYLFAILLLQACTKKAKLDAGVQDASISDASTDGAHHRMALTFPCRTSYNTVDAGGSKIKDAGNDTTVTVDAGGTRNADTGVPIPNDPNNCGQCGTLCGTYVNTGAGFSQQQGVCIGVNCNTQVPTNNPAVVLASVTTDCYDNLGPGWVVNTKDGAPNWTSKNAFYEAGVGQCINICTDPQNCGSLGHVCPPGLFCQFCQCH